MHTIPIVLQTDGPNEIRQYIRTLQSNTNLPTTKTTFLFVDFLMHPSVIDIIFSSDEFADFRTKIIQIIHRIWRETDNHELQEECICVIATYQKRRWNRLCCW